MKTFRHSLQRFPAVTAFVTTLAALLVCLCWGLDDRLTERQIFVSTYYLSVGSILTLTLRLWGEEVKSRRRRLIVNALCHVALLADAVYLYLLPGDTLPLEARQSHAALVTALCLSVPILSFLRDEDDSATWHFTLQSLRNLIISGAVGGLLCGGLCLLTASLSGLFGWDINPDWYSTWAIVCCLWLPALLFLGRIPEGDGKHVRTSRTSAFVQKVIRYLFLPLAGCYLAVLYVYAARILVRWELPDGWVSWLVVALMAGIIAIELGLYPSRIKERRPTDERIARWLPLLTLPLLVLMSVGIGRRFLDYGITINRLYLATLNLWFYFVCIGLVIGRAQRLSWIPISFSLVFLLTSVLPVNYASITRSALRDEVRETFVRSGQSIPLTTTAYEACLFSLPQKEAARLNGKCLYLRDWFGTESVQDLVAEDTPFHSYAPKGPTDTVVVEEPDFYYDADNYTLPVPPGYRYCTRLSGSGQEDGLSYSIPLHGERIAPDTLHIPTDTLRNHDQRQAPAPPVLRTQGGNLFVLTYFHSTHQISEANDGTPETRPCLKIKGLLFHNTEPITRQRPE